MADRVSPEVRSRIMSKNHQPTRLERSVSAYLSGRGIRHEMYPDMRGNPDILIRLGDASPHAVLPVFVDGCFWHACPEHYRRPKSRVAFWRDHIEVAERRRRRRRARLPYVWVRIWEHDVRAGEWAPLLRAIARVKGVSV